MLEAYKKKLLLKDREGNPMGLVRVYLSYATYSLSNTDRGHEKTAYYTALTDARNVEEGMYLMEGATCYRVMNVNTAGADTILRLQRRYTFSYLGGDSGGFAFLYDAIREATGYDLVAATGGVGLRLSVKERAGGVATLTGEMISRAPTLGKAQAQLLSVVQAINAVLEDPTSPLLSYSRGSFAYEQDVCDGSFIAKEVLDLRVEEGEHVL